MTQVECPDVGHPDTFIDSDVFLSHITAVIESFLLVKCFWCC
jgi:hypothetical protein